MNAEIPASYPAPQRPQPHRPQPHRPLPVSSGVMRVLEGFMNDLEEGKSPDPEAIIAAHPELAEPLRTFLASLEFLQGAARKLASPQSEAARAQSAQAESAGAAQLGDFRLLREIGRGGMGVVYEAEQISLARRVALKVLPFAGVLDPRQLQRFKNESRAAASLHHAHIVPVFAVGSDRGVHYYAMQYIEGRTLEEIIRELADGRAAWRQPAGVGLRSSDTKPQRERRSDAPSDALTEPASSLPRVISPHATPHSPPTAPSTARQAAIITSLSPQSKDRHSAVARLGIQIAEALDHAHSIGITHRDIKPSNLIIDDAGDAWITDFGLAQMEADAALTQTGELLGTLRYMSPEQAAGERGVLDHRTDIYSLGVTLCEMLSLRAVVGDDNRRDILQRILSDEEHATRGFPAKTPRSLQLILMKATSKLAANRYRSAGDLARDLDRFLKGEPIEARPPTAAQRLAHWSRRRPAIVTAAAIGILLLATAGGAFAVRAYDASRRRIENDRQIDALLGQIEQIDEQSQGAARLDPWRWSALRDLARRAESLATSEPSSEERRARVIAAMVELDLVARDRELITAVEEARLDNFEVADARYTIDVKLPAIAKAFRAWGIEPRRTEAKEAAALVAARPAATRDQILASLDAWRSLLLEFQNEDAELRSWLREVSTLADDDAWRAEVRAAAKKKDGEALLSFARAVKVDEPLSSYSSLVLADGLLECDRSDVATQITWRAQQAHPHDFWLNRRLYESFSNPYREQYEQALRFATACVALRPESAAAHSAVGFVLGRLNRHVVSLTEHLLAVKLAPRDALTRANLGFALRKIGDLDGAIVECRNAIALDPNCAVAYSHLGLALRDNGDVTGAEEAVRRADELQPNDGCLLVNMASVLKDAGDVNGAIDACQRALELKPEFVEAQHNLASALFQKGDWTRSAIASRAALRLQPRRPGVHGNLGGALIRLGEFDQAKAAYQTAIEIDPHDFRAYMGLAQVCLARGDWQGAIGPLRRGIEMKPKALAKRDLGQFAKLHNVLGLALVNTGQPVEGVDSIRDAIELYPDDAEFHANLAILSKEQMDWPTAIAAFERTLELDPDRPNFAINLAILYADCPDPQFRRPQEAIRLLEKEIPSLPNEPNLRTILGLAHFHAGNYDEAAAALNEALRLSDRGDLNQSLILAMIHWRLGEREAALTRHAQALQWLKDYPADPANLSEIRTRQRRLAEVEEMLELKIEPPAPE